MIKMPSELESELSVIGGCLVGGLETVLPLVPKVQPGWFMDGECGQAWALLEKMATKGTPIDGITFFLEWLDAYKTNMPVRFSVSADRASSVAVGYHLARMGEAAERRRLVMAGDAMMHKAMDKSFTIEEAQSEIHAATRPVHSSDQISGPRETILSFSDDIESRVSRKGEPTGIITGFYDLDRLTDGLQPGELTIVGARPSRGKTALALNIIERASMRDKVPALFISLEMSRNALCRRLAASFCGTPLDHLKRGRLTEDELHKLVGFNVALRQSPLYWFDGVAGATAAQICSIIRLASRLHGVRFVVVDYLQKLKAVTKHEKRTYEVAESSGMLKAAAVSCNVALLALAQLNREPERDKGRHPRLADLADSSQIERDADTVGLLHHEDGAPALHIAKQRDGELGVVKLYFNGPLCRFQNATQS